MCQTNMVLHVLWSVHIYNTTRMVQSFCILLFHEHGSNTLIIATWKVRPWMDITSWFPLKLCWFARVGCIVVPFLRLNFQIMPEI